MRLGQATQEHDMPKSPKLRLLRKRSEMSPGSPSASAAAPRMMTRAALAGQTVTAPSGPEKLRRHTIDATVTRHAARKAANDMATLLPSPPKQLANKSLPTSTAKLAGAFMFSLAKPSSLSLKVAREVLDDPEKLRHYASICFAMFDMNCDGYLNLEELLQCMHHMNTSLGVGEFTRRDVQRFLRRFDTDGNQLLDRAEYEQLYRSLLLAKLHEFEPTPFCREMFIEARKGVPEDHYQLLSVLGAGSFGIVRKVQCKQSKAVRVMKSVDKQKAIKRGYALDHLVQEIDKLKALDHPAVLRLFEYYADAQYLYLITDLLPGGDLLNALEIAAKNRIPLQESWVRQVVLQACEGLAYIHAKGIMHKDIKLENIMLSSVEPPKAVIIDVGLAELFPSDKGDSYRSGDAAGTLATMAPEVIKGSFTYKCDVWSMGCCLFALLCAKPRKLQECKTDETSWFEYFYPFVSPEHETRAELIAYLGRQRQGPHMEQLSCGSEASDLILHLLTYDQNLRPNMPQVLAHPWFQELRSRVAVLETAQLDSLMQFHRADALVQAVLLDVASQLPLGKLEEVSGLFESFDKDGNGMLDGTELAEALQHAGLGKEVATRTAARLLASCGGGSMEFSRFVAAIVSSRGDLLKRQLRSSFDRLDSNHDGFLSRAELQQLLERSKAWSRHVGHKHIRGEGGASSESVSRRQSTSELLDDSFDMEEVDLRSSVSSSASTALDEDHGSRPFRKRAARAAQDAFEAIGGIPGRSRVSFPSLQRHLAGLLA